MSELKHYTDLEEYLPEDILKKRLQLIDKFNDKYNSKHAIFETCYNCGRNIWVRWYNKDTHEYCEFDDHEKGYRDIAKICFYCRDNCLCTDSSYITRIKSSFCVICDKYVCDIHHEIENKICNECKTFISVGKQLINILKERRMKSFEELYIALDNINIK